MDIASVDTAATAATTTAAAAAAAATTTTGALPVAVDGSSIQF